MNYKLEISSQLYKKFKKLEKKDKNQLKAINKKIKQILENPYHFKPLKGDVKKSRRTHIGSFVLVYEIEEKTKTIKLLDFEHHDRVYQA